MVPSFVMDVEDNMNIAELNMTRLSN